MADIKKIAVVASQMVSDTLIRNLQAMPADKQDWKPMDLGRSALDQVQECTAINRWIADAYRTHELPPLDGEAFAAVKAELDTVEKACAGLKEATTGLCDAISSQSDADLDLTVTLPWDSTPTPFAALFMVPYWNNAYHIGQICYVQTLYGDNDMH